MPRRSDRDRDEDRPDVLIGARVKAKKLRFRSQPRTSVELHGESRTPEGRADLRTASGSDRQNLPEEVEPGVTYRDVEVDWLAAARLEDPASKGKDDEEDRDDTPEEGGRR